jgi:glucokinase
MDKYVIGVDVGGTSIKLGLISSDGRVVTRSRISTLSHRQSHKRLIDAMVEGIDDLIHTQSLKRSQVIGVGMGLPGPIDSSAGVVKYLPNIPGWKNVPLQSLLEERLKLKVRIDNDVNLIALGEWKYGAGIGCTDLVCVAFGTGVGGGLILNDQLYRGPGFVAGEIGHMIMNDPGASESFPDGYAYFEHYVGHSHLGKMAAEQFGREKMVTQDVFALAEKGDQNAKDFWASVGRRIGLGMVNIVNVLNPQIIIVGGGVSNNFKYFGPALKQEIQEKAMVAHRKMVRVVRAKLDDDAGIYGSLILVKDNI